MVFLGLLLSRREFRERCGGGFYRIEGRQYQATGEVVRRHPDMNTDIPSRNGYEEVQFLTFEDVKDLLSICCCVPGTEIGLEIRT